MTLDGVSYKVSSSRIKHQSGKQVPIVNIFTKCTSLQSIEYNRARAGSMLQLKRDLVLVLMAVLMYKSAQMDILPMSGMQLRFRL